jgi:hypothetical protein
VCVCHLSHARPNTHHFDPNLARVPFAKRRDEIVYVVYSVPVTTPENSLDSSVDAAAISAVTHPWFTEKQSDIRPAHKSGKGEGR